MAEASNGVPDGHGNKLKRRDQAKRNSPAKPRICSDHEGDNETITKEPVNEARKRLKFSNNTGISTFLKYILMLIDKTKSKTEYTKAKIPESVRKACFEIVLGSELKGRCPVSKLHSVVLFSFTGTRYVILE